MQHGKWPAIGVTSIGLHLSDLRRGLSRSRRSGSSPGREACNPARSPLDTHYLRNCLSQVCQNTPELMLWVRRQSLGFHLDHESDHESASRAPRGSTSK